MEKFRKLVDQFFCITNVALLLLFVVVVAMCLDAFTAKPMMPVDQCSVIKGAK